MVINDNHSTLKIKISEQHIKLLTPIDYHMFIQQLTSKLTKKYQRIEFFSLFWFDDENEKIYVNCPKDFQLFNQLNPTKKLLHLESDDLSTRPNKPPLVQYQTELEAKLRKISGNVLDKSFKWEKIREIVFEEEIDNSFSFSKEGKSMITTQENPFEKCYISLMTVFVELQIKRLFLENLNTIIKNNFDSKLANNSLMVCDYPMIKRTSFNKSDCTKIAVKNFQQKDSNLKCDNDRMFSSDTVYNSLLLNGNGRRPKAQGIKSDLFKSFGVIADENSDPINESSETLEFQRFGSKKSKGSNKLTNQNKDGENTELDFQNSPLILLKTSSRKSKSSDKSKKSVRMSDKCPISLIPLERETFNELTDKFFGMQQMDKPIIPQSGMGDQNSVMNNVSESSLNQTLDMSVNSNKQLKIPNSFSISVTDKNSRSKVNTNEYWLKERFTYKILSYSLEGNDFSNFVNLNLKFVSLSKDPIQSNIIKIISKDNIDGKVIKYPIMKTLRYKREMSLSICLGITVQDLSSYANTSLKFEFSGKDANQILKYYSSDFRIEVKDSDIESLQHN